MDQADKENLQQIANTIRGLSWDMVDAANSGHPGLPAGCAEIAAVLWTKFLRYNPKNPEWFNRDRFVLSAGHGSALLYSILHLTGYKVSIDEIKRFRQLDSITPGHPEYHDTDGVECTTGPLGQGVANAIGMALSYKILENRLNREGFPIVDNKIVCLAGDGCLMEGVSTEASSFAGHVNLNNLILIYDMNHITLDGPWDQSCNDNQAERYRSMGWDVVEIKNGNDLEEVERVLMKLRGEQKKPTLVIAHTVIGYGNKKKAGTHEAHGSPFGPEETKEAKKALGMSEELFYIPPAVKERFAEKRKECEKEEAKWNDLFKKFEERHKEAAELFKKMSNHHISKEIDKDLKAIKFGEKVAGRQASNQVLQVLGKHMPYLIGGSADLSGSDKTMMSDYELIKTGDFSGRNVKYGVREFGMAAMVNGMATTILRGYCGTFFCFSDYMRPAVRLAALSKYPSIFVWTHDSIFLGEDGPTHQPIEHMASLRAMPNLHVFRPGDANEVAASWHFIAHHTDNACGIVLTRQGLPTLKQTDRDFRETAWKGAYVLIEEDKSKPIDYTLMATGSELHLAVEVHSRLSESSYGKNVRVVSMPCWEQFEEQSEEYKQQVLGGDLGKRVSIEAGAKFGWERYIGPDGIAICMESFGKSAPQADLAEHFGFTADQIIERIMTPIKH